MQMHEPHEDYLIEEMRNLCRRTYGPRPASRQPMEHRLVNIERFAKLHAIAHNPYHKLIFGHLSNLDLMRICAQNLMENLDYRHASRVLRDVERLEVERAARLPPPAAAPEPAEPVEPEDIFVLDPEAQPVEPPPLTDEQRYLRSLSDREIARQYTAARQRAEGPLITSPAADRER